MRKLITLLLLLLTGVSSFGQKMTGIGAEFSAIGIKPNIRMWVSRTHGFEVFGGVAAELSDMKPNDYEAGFKYLHAFQYKRTERTYFGLVGKYKWLTLEDSYTTTELPVFQILIGKEWLNKRVHIKGFAVELGYQYGTKDYLIYSNVNDRILAKKTYSEFPLVVNFRYSLYWKR